MVMTASSLPALMVKQAVFFGEFRLDSGKPRRYIRRNKCALWQLSGNIAICVVFVHDCQNGPNRGRKDARVAQLVEQRTENPRVGGSSPPPGTTFLVSHYLSHCL